MRPLVLTLLVLCSVLLVAAPAEALDPERTVDNTTEWIECAGENADAALATCGAPPKPA